jgi:hypothetical protein
MNWPRTKLLDFLDFDGAGRHIVHGKEAHHNVFFFHVVHYERERIGVRVPTVMLDEKVSVVVGEAMTDVFFELGDLSLASRACGQRVDNVCHRILSLPLSRSNLNMPIGHLAKFSGIRAAQTPLVCVIAR